MNSLTQFSVVFQALAEGKCSIDGGSPSLHTQTARWVAEEILNIKFNAGGHCRGVGFQALTRKQSATEKLTDEIAHQLTLQQQAIQ